MDALRSGHGYTVEVTTYVAKSSETFGRGKTLTQGNATQAEPGPDLELEHPQGNPHRCPEVERTACAPVRASQGAASSAKKRGGVHEQDEHRPEPQRIGAKKGERGLSNGEHQQTKRRGVRYLQAKPLPLAP